MWGGGNANSQFGVVDDSPDCLQSRCREALVDVQCCGGVHSLWWGGGGIDVRWLNVFRRKGGIARYEGGERAVVESTALTQPGAVGSQGEGGKDGDVRSIDQFAEVLARGFQDPHRVRHQVSHASEGAPFQPAWGVLNDRQNHLITRLLQSFRQVCPAWLTRQRAERGHYRPGVGELFSQGCHQMALDGPVALSALGCRNLLAGIANLSAQGSLRDVGFFGVVGHGLLRCSCSLFGWVGSAGILNRSFPARTGCKSSILAQLGGTMHLMTSNELRTVVVPAAGLGTRFLPATKTVPKELLPVVDTPGIELIAKEAAQAGAERLAIITAPKKQGIMAHFRTDDELEATLEARGKEGQLAKVRATDGLIDVAAIEQPEPLGLGHAIGLAESHLAEDEECFAVMLPDDLVLPYGIMETMLEVRQRYGGSVLCAVEVPEEDVSKYGVFDIAADSDDPQVKKVNGMVEKPDLEDAPSNFAATGRYLLDRQVFEALSRTKPGKGGEIQITDAIELMISEGHPVHIVVHQGKRHDLGNPGGYIRACVDMALEDETYGESLKQWLEQRLGE